MKLPIILAVLLAIATPANARFYSNWRCGQAMVQVLQHTYWGEDGKKSHTYALFFDELKTPAIRSFKLTQPFGNPYLNGKSCTPMSDEEWEKLNSGMTGPYDQYHPGGAVGQISQAAGFTGAYDQYGPGHSVEQFLTATGVVPPAGPSGTAGVAWRAEIKPLAALRARQCGCNPNAANSAFSAL